VRDYVLTLLVTAAVTYVLTPLVRRLAIRVGAMHEARDRDVHVVPIPRFGGLAMYGGLAAGLLVADQIPQLRQGFVNTGMVVGLMAAGGLLVAIGIIDDRWGMSALTKLAGQVAAGGILVATGTQLNWLPEPGGSTFLPDTDQATLITILVVVATINAVNFIDGLDGLAAGIVAIAAISFFLYYYRLTQVIDVSSLAAPALASAVLIGMCLGFLPHNFSPAKIFMGDSGSMLLGLLLAYAPISSISSLDPALLARVNRYPEIMPLLLPAALLVIPYADLLLAVVRRTRAGTSPFTADRKHLHHRLLDIGHSQRSSVLIMYLWAVLFSGSVVWLSIEKTVHPGAANHHGQPILVFVGITVAALAALLLMTMPRLRGLEGRSRRAVTAGAAAGQPAPRPAAEATANRAPAEQSEAAVQSAIPAVEPARPELAAVAASAATAVAPAPGRRPLPHADDSARGPFEPAQSDVTARSELSAPGPARLSSGWSEPVIPASSARRTLPARSIVGTVPPAVAGSEVAPAEQDGLPRRVPAGNGQQDELPRRIPGGAGGPGGGGFPESLPWRLPPDQDAEGPGSAS
jgi:UDP-GlcNAc:undecaprenyl-phosphate/decaprenyl-phosphate GlcNAc-1-phosphate transferase